MVKRLPAQWDWILGYALIGVAGIVILVTWVAVSGSRFLSDQLSYIVSGGLGGLLILGLGSVLIVTAGLSDEWRKLNRLEDALSGPALEPRSDASAVVGRARLLAALGAAVSVAFLLPTWYTVSGDTDPKPGLSAITWAVVGLVIGGLIAALATMWVQHRIQARQRQLFAPWAATFDGERVPVSTDAGVPQPGHVVISPDLTRFHLPGCPAVRGIATRGVELGSIPPALEPCDLCEADTIVREETTWTSVAG